MMLLQMAKQPKATAILFIRNMILLLTPLHFDTKVKVARRVREFLLSIGFRGYDVR